jgi:hypothetical protein
MKMEIEDENQPGIFGFVFVSKTKMKAPGRENLYPSLQ